LNREDKLRLAQRIVGSAFALLAASPALAQQPPGSTATAPMRITQAQPAPMRGMPGMPTSQGTSGNPGGKQGTGSGSPASQALTQSMQKMQQDMMDAPTTGNADQDFVAMMIPHHQGAIDMARVELQYGTDPMLRRLARSIVSAQQKEIREMKDWQGKHPVNR
jgi:uncharacterized protein (DUF305 family)